MKTIANSILALLLITLISCKPTLVNDTASETPQAVNAFQQASLDEINLARTSPAMYADLRLKTFTVDSTDNGSYSYLKNLTPRQSLTFNSSLNLAASNYAAYLAENNLMGHDFNGNPLKRAITVGFTGYSIGENIAAATGDECNSASDPKMAAIHFVQLMMYV